MTMRHAIPLSSPGLLTHVRLRPARQSVVTNHIACSQHRRCQSRPLRRQKPQYITAPNGRRHVADICVLRLSGYDVGVGKSLACQ